MPEIPASDNEFPKALFEELASDPAAPAAGILKLFARNDGKFYRLQSNGTTTELGGGGGGGSGYVAAPSNSTDTGTEGNYATDGNYLFVCIATNTWKRIALNTYGSGAYTFAFDGDTNGVCYAIGSVTGVWSNPHTSGQLTVVTSALAGGTATHFVNRTSDLGVFTSNVANSFVGVDLGLGRTLVPNYYSMRARGDDGTNLPRNWKLQGTNSVSANTESGWNAATWTDIDTKTANTTINAAAAWGSFACTTATPFRYLRILQNGTNSSGANFFCIAEVEFYGTLSL